MTGNIERWLVLNKIVTQPHSTLQNMCRIWVDYSSCKINEKISHLEISGKTIYIRRRPILVAINATQAIELIL